MGVSRLDQTCYTSRLAAAAAATVRFLSSHCPNHCPNARRIKKGWYFRKVILRYIPWLNDRQCPLHGTLWSWGPVSCQARVKVHESGARIIICSFRAGPVTTAEFSCCCSIYQSLLSCRSKPDLFAVFHYEVLLVLKWNYPLTMLLDLIS